MLYDTELFYMKDSYLREYKTEIIGISKDEKGNPVTYLDSTIFYPEGGGQPSDQGVIKGENGTAKIIHAKYSLGIVNHIGEIEGSLNDGDSVTCEIDWELRYRNMRVHSAGHLVHDALMQLPVNGIFPAKGHHGNSPFIEYTGDISAEILPELERISNEMVSSSLKTNTKLVDFEELKKLSRFVPPTLPKDKQLRIFWIEGCEPMPDGGTQVNNTNEIGQIKIISIAPKKGFSRIRYEVVGLES